MLDYAQLKIKAYTHWDLYLHANQCYLGRVFLQLKDDKGFDDFLAISEEVREEFFLIGKEIKRVLKSLWGPDKMNYAALSNVSEKIHVHFIPRYQQMREFQGMLFTDSRWGQNYAPYDLSFILEESALFAIRDALKNLLK